MKCVRVTAGIIRKGKKFLIAQRKESEGVVSLLWEFPGGKIEDKETAQECLKRELREELSIEVVVGDLFRVSKHSYPKFGVRLSTFVIDDYNGKMTNNSHKKLKWVSLNELDNYQFAPADIPVVEKLKKVFK